MYHRRTIESTIEELTSLIYELNDANLKELIGDFLYNKIEDETTDDGYFSGNDRVELNYQDILLLCEFSESAAAASDFLWKGARAAFSSNIENALFSGDSGCIPRSIILFHDKENKTLTETTQWVQADGEERTLCVKRSCENYPFPHYQDNEKSIKPNNEILERLRRCRVIKSEIRDSFFYVYGALSRSAPSKEILEKFLSVSRLLEKTSEFDDLIHQLEDFKKSLGEKS